MYATMKMYSWRFIILVEPLPLSLTYGPNVYFIAPKWKIILHNDDNVLQQMISYRQWSAHFWVYLFTFHALWNSNNHFLFHFSSPSKYSATEVV